MMNWNQISEKWASFQDILTTRWGRLTKDDLVAISGRRDAFLERLQQRYDCGPEKAEKELHEWLMALDVSVSPPSPPRQTELDLERSEGEGMGQGRYSPEPHA